MESEQSEANAFDLGAVVSKETLHYRSRKSRHHQALMNGYHVGGSGVGA
jgi:hypothetical protein